MTLETHLIDEGSLSFPQGGAEAVRLEVALLIQRLERQHLHHSSSGGTDEGGASSLHILTPAGHSSSTGSRMTRGTAGAARAGVSS